MFNRHVPNLQELKTAWGANVQTTYTLAAHTATSLWHRHSTKLKIVSGQAWVTSDNGPYGACEHSGDVVLLPGQTLCIPAGQHFVVEPLIGDELRFQWRVDGGVTCAPPNHRGRRVDVKEHSPIGGPLCGI